MVCNECAGKSLPHTHCRGESWCDCAHNPNARYVNQEKEKKDDERGTNKD